MNTNANHRRDIFEELARLGGALSSSARMEMLELLAQGPRTVEEVAVATGQSVANASHHLKVLRATGLVVAERDGRTVWCRVAGPDVVKLMVALQRVGEERLERVRELMDGAVRGADAVVSVGPGELLAMGEAGGVVLIDVRSAREYGAGHLPGAVSVPLDELRARLSELPRDQQIVAYCRGRMCVMAAEAVELLTGAGHRASHLDGGVMSWIAEGGPLTISTAVEAR